ncbi:hypothetical protein K9M79_01130 [Candidatus Woesearchaeota archaeon]|nr:hypothetical protein [Candidatus Woesearchaeota archaeon]
MIFDHNIGAFIISVLTVYLGYLSGEFLAKVLSQEKIEVLIHLKTAAYSILILIALSVFFVFDNLTISVILGLLILQLLFEKYHIALFTQAILLVILSFQSTFELYVCVLFIYNVITGSVNYYTSGRFNLRYVMMPVLATMMYLLMT